MSEIKNSGSDQYGAEPFQQQQVGTAGVEGVNRNCLQTFRINPVHEQTDKQTMPHTEEIT